MYLNLYITVHHITNLLQSLSYQSGGYKRRPRPHSAFDALKPKIKPVKDEALSAEMVRQSKFPAAKKPSASQPAKVSYTIN